MPNGALAAHLSWTFCIARRILTPIHGRDDTRAKVFLRLDRNSIRLSRRSDRFGRVRDHRHALHLVDDRFADTQLMQPNHVGNSQLLLDALNLNLLDDQRLAHPAASHLDNFVR